MAKKLPGNIGAKNRIFQKYKKRAERSSIVFKLSKKFFIELTQNNCYYCGVAPSNILQHRDYYTSVDGKKKTYQYGKPFQYNGLDRKNNNEGYTKENCVACCAICNRAKYRLTIQEFKNWIKQLKDYNE